MYFGSILLIGGGFIAALFLFNKTESPEINMISALFFSVIYFPLMIIMAKDRFRRWARKIYSDPNNKKLFSTLKLSLNDAGILGKDEFSEFQYKWAGIIKRHATENLYILFSSDIAGLVIPKRIFKSESEKEAFEKLLAQHIPLQAEQPVSSR